MKLYLFTYLLICLTINCFSQPLRFSGTIRDTSMIPSQHPALIVVLKYRDSSLVAWARTDKHLSFSFHNLPVDTYKVIISRKGFSDRTIFLIGSEKNYVFEMNNIILPPPSVQLDEVTILAFREPVYYHGDTLVYVADSFKVRPDATIEDLLKKLPGIQVTAQGKIKAQGKEVSKVLLDGDEYFGSDYTLITRNMEAGQVENVKVFDEKNPDDPNETNKVMNIELKESAKKGVHGNVYGAYGTERYYESSALVNAFSPGQKITFTGRANNTRGSVFDDYYFTENEDGFFTASDEMGETISEFDNTGLPVHQKASLNYQLNTGKHTKWNLQYAFKRNLLRKKNDNRYLYQLPDTSFTLNDFSDRTTGNISHILRLRNQTRTDSLGKLITDIKFGIMENADDLSMEQDFYDMKGSLNRNTSTRSDLKGKQFRFYPSIEYTRNFHKKFRELNFRFSSDISRAEKQGMLSTKNNFFLSAYPGITDFDQKKNFNHLTDKYTLSIGWQEPLNENIFIHFKYGFNHHHNYRKNLAFNKSGDFYVLTDSAFSGEFSNNTQSHVPEAGISYKTDKWRVNGNIRCQYNQFQNKDFFRNLEYQYPFLAWQPQLIARYTPNRNKNFSFHYAYLANPPVPDQLITIPDNRNQNFVQLGNPELLPSRSHSFNFNHWFYTGLTRKYLFMSIRHVYSPIDISTESGFDSLGRSVSKPVNVKGNRSSDASMSIDIPLFDQLLNVGPSVGFHDNIRQTIVNRELVRNRSRRYSGGLSFSMELENASFFLYSEYSHYRNTSDRYNEMNVPYSDFSAEANINLKFFKERLGWNTDINYEYYGNRPRGYNLSPVIINSGLNFKIFKKHKWYAEFTVHDLLNNNVSVERNIYQNYILDSRTLVVRRYFLLGLRWKFNSNKNSGLADENEE